MKIEISTPTYQLLKEVLTILSNAETQHFALHGDEELIEPWTPLNSDEQISCPELTVGLLRKAQRLKEQLKIQ